MFLALDTQRRKRKTLPFQGEKTTKKGGEIFFKTDDDELFAESLEYFKESGSELTFITYDMTENSLPDNIIHEHEQLFMNDGIKIKGLIAVYPED